MLDVAFDAVGLKSTFEQALDSVTVGGRLVGVGMSAESPSVGPTSMFGLTQKHVLATSGIRTSTSKRSPRWCHGVGWTVALHQRHRFPRGCQVGIEKLERQDGNPIRILVKP